MTKQSKLARNIFILGLFSIFSLMISQSSLHPWQAHRVSELTMSYGPSQVVHTQQLSFGKKLYLCKYETWCSLDIVQQAFPGLWRPHAFLTLENNAKEPVSYTWQWKQDTGFLVFGIVNDSLVTSVQVCLKDSSSGDTQTLAQGSLYSGMFLFVLPEAENTPIITRIAGYDSSGSLLFEKQLDAPQ